MSIRDVGRQRNGQIVRYEFLGNWLLFWLLCISGIGLLAALVYLMNSTLRIEESLEDPERFVAEYRSGRLASA